jgi:hypothetical protein
MKERVSDERLLPTVARVIDEQKEVVWDYVKDDLPVTGKGEIPSGDAIVDQILEEENGRSYLEFCYSVETDGKEDRLDTVVEYARGLVGEEEMALLEQNLEEMRTLLLAKGEEIARGLAPSQRAAFWKDMQKLVTRTLVLFTAGIVYACIPNVVFWGKVSAASAVAVAAGVVSTSIMSIWRYYQFGGNLEESFEEWLMAVSTEPEVSVAMASSMLAVGKTLERGPVVTGIVICVFALYNVVDMIKPMLKQYDFTV